MSNWTPTVIGERAKTVADLAKQIDMMLWHVQQYKVERREEFGDDLHERIDRLSRAIMEFNELDTSDILLKLEKDIVLFKQGVL